jgi:hypothetical protein
MVESECGGEKDVDAVPNPRVAEDSGVIRSCADGPNIVRSWNASMPQPNTTNPSTGHRRLFKFIISPEFGDRVDLERLTRDLMTRMARDLATRLE